MRNAFIDELVSLAALRDNIFLIVGDLGYSVVEPFIERFPDRFLNAGVAEQNMTSLAAGMASEGYHVFTYSIANFPTFRCAEQLRNDVDYHALPVTVVAVGGGLAYGGLGYSHHAVQDFALMRTMPNMLIAAPGDPMEVRACLRYLVEHPQPSYLRLGKAGEPSFHLEPPSLHPGEWMCVRAGATRSSKCVVTTGATLELAIRWQTQREEFRDFDVCSLPLWGMATKSTQANFVRKFERVISLEDHLSDGGFGSWLMESLPQGEGLRERLLSRALNSVVCGMVGTQDFLNEMGGLNQC